MAAGPAHASDPFSLVGQTLGGRFQIERFVAEGGFGVVYRGRQVALDRPVAIKILKAAPDLRHETFEAEAKTVARLKHPNIVEVYDFGVTEGPSGLVLHWMALEWMEGRTLAALLEEERNLGRPRRDPAAAMELLKPVLQAVAFAHQQGVAHRDLKPANIFVAGQPGESSLKVLDFGVAQLLAPDRKNGGETTQRGPAGFSPDYAAPEQVSYGRTGPWTDVHALGLMLTELLVGAAPYDASDPEARFAQVIAERRPTPSTRGLDVGAWEVVLQKALARRPAERHPNAGALLAALKQENAPAALRFRRKSLWMALAGAAAIALAFLGWRMLPRSSTAEVSDRIKIAALPFENLTGDPQQEYFSDGLTDGVIGELGRLLPERLAVTSRTSVNRYKKTDKTAKQIGGELGVQHLLTSSVRRQGDQLHVESHLVRVSDETEIWADRYDRPIAEVLDLQAQIARDVAHTIRLKLGAGAASVIAGKRPVKPAAYEAYLRGRYLSDRSAVEQQLRIAAFEEAIKLDSNFAPAFAGLANALESLQAGGVKPSDVEPRWRWAALRALELDDNLPEAHAILAVLLLRYDWNWAGAERHLKRALELDANDVKSLTEYGMFYLTVGRFNDAIAVRTRAMEVDPLTGGWRLGAAYYHARQYDQAIAQLQATLAAEPSGPARSHLARAYAEKGMTTEAAREAEQLLQGSHTPVVLGSLGYALARAGQEKRARELLERLSQLSKSTYVQPIYPARIHAGLHERDEAFALLEQAFQERSPDLTFLRVDPAWDSLRNDPRFADLARRVGIPTASGEAR